MKKRLASTKRDAWKAAKLQDLQHVYRHIVHEAIEESYGQESRILAAMVI